MKKFLPYIAILSVLMFVYVPLNAQKASKYELFASIAGFSRGEISKTLLLGEKPILCSDQKIEIVYFSLSVFRKNGDLIVYNGSGNTLSESMKIEIQALEPGSKLVIEDIGAKTPDDKIIKLPAIVLILK
jgi:hypothetical protein